MSKIKDILGTVKVRYPGAPHSVPLKDLLERNEITAFLRAQYPDIEEPGHVQFIPQLRGE